MQPLTAQRVTGPRGVAEKVVAQRPSRGVRRDPAPSKWDYRLQRLMLTPYVRAFLIKGLPSLVVLGAVALWFSHETNRQAVIGQLTHLREEFEARPEFRVSLARVEGASDDLAAAVRVKLALPLPMSSFDIDLDAARARIEALDAVKKADLRVRSGGVLQVLITERMPVAIWRTEDGLTLVDETGHRVAGLMSRADRADLPLIAGDGADKATPEALDLIAAAGPLTPRVRGLVRMGDRRWDLVLDRDQRVLLPEDNPVQALERLLALDHAQDLMNRDILTVDLRSDHRPTLRLTPHALAEVRRAQGLETVENEL